MNVSWKIIVNILLPPIASLYHIFYAENRAPIPPSEVASPLNELSLFSTEAPISVS